MFDHMTNIADGYKYAFYELYRLTKIACTIPISTASVECSFNALKRIKTSTTMTDERFDSSVDSLESPDKPKILIYEQVLDMFIKMYPNCRIVEVEVEVCLLHDNGRLETF